jgi:fatty acid elongase 3
MQHINSFRWEAGTTPLSSLSTVVPTVVGYLLVSLLLERCLVGKNKKPVLSSAVLTKIVLVHNAGLCLLSAAMFLGVSLEVVKLIGQLDAFPSFDVYCDPGGKLMDKSGSAFTFWAYVYYLSKFWEMGDTLIMLLKQKNLTFLQCYHHSVIVGLCWIWLENGWSVCWWGIWCNSLVHVFMYYYFSISALGRSVWWKKYLTAGQLVQFSTVFLVCQAWIVNSLQGDDVRWYNPIGAFTSHSSSRCAGKAWTVYASQAVNVSFLLLFGAFFLNPKNFAKKPTKAE